MKIDNKSLNNQITIYKFLATTSKAVDKKNCMIRSIISILVKDYFMVLKGLINSFLCEIWISYKNDNIIDQPIIISDNQQDRKMRTKLILSN